MLTQEVNAPPLSYILLPGYLLPSGAAMAFLGFLLSYPFSFPSIVRRDCFSVGDLKVIFPRGRGSLGRAGAS